MRVYKCDCCGKYFDELPKSEIKYKPFAKRGASYEDNNTIFHLVFSVARNHPNEATENADLCKDCVVKLISKYS